MDDAQRLAGGIGRLVRGVEAEENVVNDRGRDGDRAPRPHPRDRLDQRRERLAMHVLHDEEDFVFGGDDIERRDDVRVADQQVRGLLSRS